MFRIWSIIFVLVSSSFTDDFNQSDKKLIDTAHKYISEKFESISNITDDITSNTINYTKKIVNINSVDSLFKNEKFIEDTKKSFLRLSSDYSYNTLDDDDFNIRLNAKLALNKSRKNFNLYISGLNQDNIGEIVKKDKSYSAKSEIGISYVALLKQNIETKYSLGIRSLYPYIKARISYKKKLDIFELEPIQTIEYSSRNEFKEYTQLYLDTKVIDNVKFRLELSRGTSSKNIGMDYSSVASVFWTPLNKTGFRFSQGIYGNTKYKYIVDEITKETKEYNKINNYVTTLTFRQNVYRKWLFYEISPSVNFHKEHDFNQNYRLYLRLDVFFGNM